LLIDFYVKIGTDNILIVEVWVIFHGVRRVSNMELKKVIFEHGSLYLINREAKNNVDFLAKEGMYTTFNLHFPEAVFVFIRYCN